MSQGLVGVAEFVPEKIKPEDPEVPLLNTWQEAHWVEFSWIEPWDRIRPAGTGGQSPFQGKCTQEPSSRPS